MKRLYYLLIALFWASSAIAQEDPGSALPLSLESLLMNTATGSCTTINGTLGATASALPACDGVATDDIFYSFTSTSQGVRISANSGTSDLVLELLDNSLASLECVNATNGVGAEELIVRDLTIGDTYYLRVHSATGAGGTFDFCPEFLTPAEVRAGWHPLPASDAGLPGYRIDQVIARNNYSATENSSIQATEWEFTDINTGLVYTGTTNGSNGLTLLNSIGGLCFNTSYDVRVQVQVNGIWCGFGEVRQIDMEVEPTTELENAYVGQYYFLDDDLKARFVGSGQILEWRLTTDNGETVFTHVGGSSSFLFLADIECIRYNKVYNIEVRATYCGLTGPWSPPSFIFTNPIPYTQLRPEFCDSDQFSGGSIQCEFVPVADQYGWQFAPIEPGDPTMTPIGPAIVAYSQNNTVISMNGLGLTPGATYRVGVKPMVGNFDSCDDPQEGDYGIFCPLHIIDPGFAPLPVQPPAYAGSGITTEVSAPVIFPNPVTDGALNLHLPEGAPDGAYSIWIYDLKGTLVHADEFSKLGPANVMQFTLPDGLATGRYQVGIQSPDEDYRQSILIAPR